MSKELAIQIEGVWKQYGLTPALRQRYAAWRGFSNSEEGQWALRDINLEVRKGETLGVIGRNGAGKSTLLKILAGVSQPTRGKIKVEGRIFPMIELNAGLHMDLTGRENIYLLGAIMGLSRNEIRGLLPSIEEFSELREFFDLPVRKYSSGMLARLGFSVAVNVRAEILLIDEVFSVGDIAFQQKCFRKMEEIIQSGSTILFVSHAMRNVERICENAVLMDHGMFLDRGRALDVVSAYFRVSADSAAQELIRRCGGVAPIIHTGTGEIRVVGAEIIDSSGQPSDVIRYRDPYTVRIHLWVKCPVRSPHVMVTLSTPDLINVAAVSTARGQTFDFPDFEPGEWIVDCRLAANNMLPGVYMVNVAFDSKNGPKIETVRQIRQFQVVVSGHGQQENNMPGFFWMDCAWDYFKNGEKCSHEQK